MSGLCCGHGVILYLCRTRRRPGRSGWRFVCRHCHRAGYHSLCIKQGNQSPPLLEAMPLALMFGVDALQSREKSWAGPFRDILSIPEVVGGQPAHRLSRGMSLASHPHCSCRDKDAHPASRYSRILRIFAYNGSSSQAMHTSQYLERLPPQSSSRRLGDHRR